MAAGNFARCLAHTLEFEGGWSNHPADPGGATMRGVIQRVYDNYRVNRGLPKQTVRNISEAELQEIYRKNYWDLVKGDNLATGVDLATFDFGVNSGPSRANKYLANAIGGTSVQTIQKLCAARLAFVRGLGTFSVFGKGWTRRITTIEARSVKMALSAGGATPGQVSDTLKKESTAANKKAKQQGGGAVAGGGGAVAVEQVGQLPPAVFVVVAIGIAAVVAFLIYRSYINKQRAKAYAAVAEEKS